MVSVLTHVNQNVDIFTHNYFCQKLTTALPRPVTHCDAVFNYFPSLVTKHSFATMGKRASWPLSNVTVLSLAGPRPSSVSKCRYHSTLIKHSRECLPGKPVSFFLNNYQVTKHRNDGCSDLIRNLVNYSCLFSVDGSLFICWWPGRLYSLSGKSLWPTHGGGVSAFNCNCLAERCCFNILYRFLCNTLTRRQPEARINSVKGSSFVKSQSCFNDAWRNILALTFFCQVSFEKSIKIILLWPSYLVNAY